MQEVKIELVGTYELISHGRFDSAGTFSPSGHQMSGQLMYSEDGFMSVFITFVNDSLEFSDMVIYTGRYSFDESKIIHHIENSPKSTRRNTEETRYYKQENDTLVLTTPQTPDGYFEIKWQKRTSNSKSLPVITHTLNLKKEPLLEEIELTLDLGRYIGWNDNSDFTDDLEALLKKIVRFAEADPDHGLEVFRIFIAACLEKSEEVDSSDGSLATFFDELMCEWAKVCTVVGISGKDFLAELERLKKADSIGYLMDVEAQVIPGLDSKLSLALENDLKEKIGLSNNQGSIPKELITENKDHIKYLKMLYNHNKNLDALIEFCKIVGTTSKDYLSIANIYFSNGNLEETLSWIEKAISNKEDLFSSYELEKLQQEVLLKMGRHEDVANKAWSRFEKSHSWYDLENLLKVVSESELSNYKLRATEVLKGADLDDAISGLFKIGELTVLADKIVAADEKELRRLFYGESIRVAESLTEKYPDAAIRIYISQANRILEDKKSKAYHHAHNYLFNAKVLMFKLGQQAQWQTFATELCAVHKRKSSFMEGFKQILNGKNPNDYLSFEELIAKRLK